MYWLIFFFPFFLLETAMWVVILLLVAGLREVRLVAPLFVFPNLPSGSLSCPGTNRFGCEIDDSSSITDLLDLGVDASGLIILII